MGRHSVVGKEKIQEAALSVFLQKGFDAASMRDVAECAGCSVGLAYNYFQTKDDVFASAIDLFFARYEKELSDIVAESQRSPFRALTEFFLYLDRETRKFRLSLAERVHWTVRFAIREKALAVIEPFLGQIVDNLISWGATPPLTPAITTALLTYGVGSMLLHEDMDAFPSEKRDVALGVNLIMGIPPEDSGLAVPLFVSESMQELCVDFVRQQQAYLPAFDEEAFRASFAGKTARREILMICRHDEPAGVLSYTRETNSIDFMAIDPAYYGRGVAARLLVTALAQLPVGVEISLTVPSGLAEAMGFYRAMGFASTGTREIAGRACQTLTRQVPATARELYSGTLPVRIVR